ncbi:olfactory receptor 1019-like [Rana temporaria]|uniref:olfactory receptor 1019-like n=1 Tax=Rana temporaria TaxID=8407 RepID=UPI001AAD8ACC|nr:olfactory receptor 1019-like [Rana temporaria]
MDQRNQTIVTFFIFQGISDLPELQTLIFFLVLFIYLLSLGVNLTIFLLVCLDHQLHTPMYFLLTNLSVLDMFSTTVTLHNILIGFIIGDNTISYGACLSEMYIYGFLICDELLILTAMSYDRYVAICNPLQYHLVMNRKVCILLGSWLLGILEVIPYIVILAGFTCYTSNVINHFFCDLVPLVKLSCSDTTAMEIVCLADGFVLISFTPFMLTFISYIFIISSILRISSKIGRTKAFYTCSSHLTVVILLYSSLFFQYLKPTSLNTTRSNKFFSLYNTAALPLLNPLIYSFKNKDVKSAMMRTAHWFKVCM